MNEERLLLQSIKDYAIFMLDINGRVASWNEAARQIKGYDAEEIIGKHFSVFYPEESKIEMDPQRELEIAVTNGKFEQEGWRLKKDGSLFWASVVITPLYDDQQKHIGFTKVTRDLTAKKESEDALRKSEERYRLLVEQVKDYGIFMLNETGHISSWNKGAERIKGYRSDEIIGKHFSIFYPPEDIASQKPQKELVIAIREGKFEEENWRLRKDGGRFWANVVITSLFNEKGIHIGFAKVTRDLTERKIAETELKESNIRYQRLVMKLKKSNELLEQFAYVVSHDLKEPLRKVSFFGDFLLSSGTEQLSESIQKNINKMVDAARRMNVMIDDILSFSTLSQKEEFYETNLQKILDDTIELLESQITEANAIIDVDGLPVARVIPGQMRQLFQNLLSNSLKFSNKNIPTVIRITHDIVGRDEIDISQLKLSEHYLRIVFQDNGIGFKQEFAEKIFNLFHRLHGRSEFEGTGLGLAICQKVVENHDGMIIAKSEIDRGAVFTVIIPYHK